MATSEHTVRLHEIMLANGWGWDAYDLLPWLTVGLAIGISQWLFLLGKVRNSGLWIPATVIVHLIYGAWVSSAGMFGFLVVPMAATVAGLISAGVMFWLLASMNKVEEKTSIP